MARKSSITLQHNKKVAAGYFFHNSREKPTANSIFDINDNYTNISGKKALKSFWKEFNKRAKKYTERTKKKLPKNTIKHISAIMNIKADTRQEDIKKVIEYLENSLDTKIIQYAIHKDEGHINENGEKKINYHVHIEMIGIDSEGRSIRKKISRSYLRNLQTKVAKFLKMERGQDIRKTKRKRLDTYQYKEYKKREEKEIQELKKALKEKEKENAKLKKENEKLKEQLKLTKEQKSEAIKLLKNLRNDIKNINKAVQLYTAEDYKKISEIQKALRKNKIQEISELKQSINTLIKYFKNQLKEYEQENMQRILEYEEIVKQTTKLKPTGKSKQIHKAHETLQQYSDYEFGL